MEWLAAAFSGIGVAVVSSLGTWLFTKWRAYRASAQWTLEHVKDDEWTLRRDSPRTAFTLNVYEFGDGSGPPNVKVTDYLRRMDIKPGMEVNISGVIRGTEVRLDWVEGDARLATRVLVREGVTKLVIVRRDTREYDDY
jgi:hypothetical protein